MRCVEGPGLFQIDAGGREIRRLDMLLALGQELIDEGCCLHLLARLISKDARFVVHQVVRQHFGRDVERPLEVSSLHGLPGNHHRVAR